MLIIWHELVLREFKKQINSLKRTIWVKRDENKLKTTTKVMISCLKPRNIRKEGEFPFVLCIKKVDSNSILCKFCKCQMHEGCICITSRLKLVMSLNPGHAQVRKHKQGGVLELNSESFDIVKKFCYRGYTLGAIGFVVYSVVAKVRNRLSKFRDFCFCLLTEVCPQKE